MAADGNERGDPVDFGFRTVAREDKPGLVRGLFAGVAGSYDRMNDVMSLGIHRLWKDAMVDWLAPRAGMRVLDLAGGTGDVAFRVLDRTRGEAEVVVCDSTEGMMAEGRTRRDTEHFGDALRWVCGDGAALPFPDAVFDACTVAFGLRNVADLDAVLAEAHRVLEHGGKFLCLEFSHVHPRAIEVVYDAWSMHAIPRIGAVVARDGDAYRYLVESIRRFPDQETLAAAMRKAGFERVRWRNLSFGIAALHSGWRI